MMFRNWRRGFWARRGIASQEGQEFVQSCSCFACNPEYQGFRMFVCAICGNKRCPHAESHENPCTGSNAPGQKGATRYPTPACYCVCHTPISSRAWCEHCQGDNEVTRSWKKRADEQSKQAKQAEAMQRLHDINAELADWEAETGAPPWSTLRHPPSGEEEGRQ